MAEFLLVFVLAIGFGWPLGGYLASVMKGEPMRWSDRIFGWLERPLYLLLNVDPTQGMSWKTYVRAFLVSNAILALPVWLILMNQAALPLNPNGAANMRWDLALHTMISFLTNTNQQHYAGQAQLSHFSQMTAIVGLQVITPMMGLAVVAATLRALFGGRKREGESMDIGNYWADVIRPTVRVLMPLCLLFSVILTSQGVPATISGGPVVTVVDPTAELSEQKIPLGPVAPMVAIKQLGTNGGGWYGANSAVPLENPTPLTNLLQNVALILLPVAVAFMVGPFTGRRGFSWLVVGCMLAMSTFSAGAAVWSEAHSVTSTAVSVMEGKEVRIGADGSSLWASVTTQASNGAVNAMHDSMSPLTGMVAMGNMLVNAIWGGVGCGLQQFLVYMLIAVFLAGLMTGRTPEIFGRKIEAGEVKLLAVLVLLQPVVLLGLTAITLSLPSLTANSNPGFHGISQVFYEFASAYANNGSGFEGLGDASYWWNIACAAVLLLGRYPALVIPLVIAAMLGGKRAAVEGSGALQVETPTFAITTVSVIVILTLLQFMPALVLGPVAEHMSLTID